MFSVILFILLIVVFIVYVIKKKGVNIKPGGTIETFVKKRGKKMTGGTGPTGSDLNIHAASSYEQSLNTLVKSGLLTESQKREMLEKHLGRG